MRRVLCLAAFAIVSCTTSADRHADADAEAHAQHDDAAHALASIVPETPLRVLAYFRCPDGDVIWTVNTRSLTELHLADGRRIDLPAIGDRHYSDGTSSVRYLRPGLEVRLGDAVPVICDSHVPEGNLAFRPSE